jgi:hypothetical protein
MRGEVKATLPSPKAGKDRVILDPDNPMAPLSPAESLFLLKPNWTPARETVKVTLLSLLAQGAVQMGEKATRRLFGTKKTVYVRPTAKRPRCRRTPLPCSRSMADLVTRAQKAYGTNLNGFNRDFIIPALLSRGLIEDSRILLFRTYKRTPAGDAEETRIASDIARARTIPELIHSNPAEAAAIILAVGGTILLVNELRPYYRQISDVMRAQTASTDSVDSGGDGLPLWSSSDSHPAQPGDPALHLDHEGLGSFDHGTLDHATFDLSAFDAGAFDALDTGMASFDSGFDTSVSDAGGGDGGGSDGGGGGGGGGDPFCDRRAMPVAALSSHAAGKRIAPMFADAIEVRASGRRTQ